MSDSLLVEALVDTRRLLDEVEDEDTVAAMALRVRVDVLDRASAALELRPAKRDEIIHLAQLAIEVREAAAALRERRNSIAQVVEKMID